MGNNPEGWDVVEIVITSPPSISAQVAIYKATFDRTECNHTALAAVNEFLEVPYSSYQEFIQTVHLSRYQK